MKKIFILTCLFILGSNSSVLAKAYQHALFSCNYPDDWKSTLDEYPTSSEITFTKNDSTGSPTGILIQVLPAPKTLDEAVKNEIAKINQNTQFQTFVSQTQTKVSGEPATQLIRKIHTQAIKAKQTDTFVQKSGHLFHISYVIEETQNEVDLVKLFEETIKSLVLK